MYAKKTAVSPWLLLGAAMAACTLFSGSVAAKDHAVTVSIQVSAQGLDVSQPRGAQKLYWRLKRAAWVACTDGDRVGLEPSPEPERCGVSCRSAEEPGIRGAEDEECREVQAGV